MLPVGCIDGSYLRQWTDGNSSQTTAVPCQSTFCQDEWCKTGRLHTYTKC